MELWILFHFNYSIENCSRLNNWHQIFYNANFKVHSSKTFSKESRILKNQIFHFYLVKFLNFTIGIGIELKSRLKVLKKIVQKHTRYVVWLLFVFYVMEHLARYAFISAKSFGIHRSSYTPGCKERPYFNGISALPRFPAI